MRITLKGKISAALLVGLITIITISYFVINMVLNKNLEEYIKSDMKGIITYSKESCSSLIQLENTNNTWITLNKISSLFNVYINWKGENVGQVVYEDDINEYKDLENDTKSLLKLSNNNEFFYATLYYPLYVNSQYEWNLIIQKDYSDIFSSNKSVLNVVLASEMIMIAILFIVIYLITNKSTKPLRKLTRAMESLGMGQEIEDLPIETKDDISIITEGFNDMKNNIAEMQNNTKELFNNATHELKTPLTAIRGYSQMLQDEDFEDEFVLRAVERIEEESIKMNKLVEKLLMISREEVLVQVYPEEININKMTKRIIDAFHNQIQNKGINIQLEENDEVKVKAIKEDMESILTNLIENSLKYSTTKNINIELGKSDKKSYFKLYNGIGDINEDIKYKLLEPFIKGRTNDSEISSSGLGLYICKRLCEKNDLKIDYYIENGFIKFIITIN
ncbi:MAG: HAMP domain-containing sensor histidine kinase [Turicibacter sp.]|nr:HAMP domain-containing sensor histidine kinase [Turicibacter sp.]